MSGKVAQIGGWRHSICIVGLKIGYRITLQGVYGLLCKYYTVRTLVDGLRIMEEPSNYECPRKTQAAI